MISPEPVIGLRIDRAINDPIIFRAAGFVSRGLRQTQLRDNDRERQGTVSFASLHGNSAAKTIPINNEYQIAQPTARYSRKASNHPPAARNGTPTKGRWGWAQAP